MVSASKVAQIDCEGLELVGYEQSLIEFVSSLIKIVFHARIDARFG
jgi:hypothetical protein